MARHDAWAGRLEPAIERQRDVVEGYREQLGPYHSKTSDGLLRLANMLSEDGEHQGAQRVYQEARDVLVHAYGPGHPRVADLIANAAIDQLESGHVEDARTSFVEAEAIYLASLGPEASMLLKVHMGLVQVALASGDTDQAAERAERAVEMASSEKFSTSERLGALALFAMAAAASGDHDQAIASCREYLQQAREPSVSSSFQINALYTRQMLVEQLLELDRKNEAASEARGLLVELSHHADDQGLVTLGDSARAALARAVASGSEPGSSTGV